MRLGSVTLAAHVVSRLDGSADCPRRLTSMGVVVRACDELAAINSTVTVPAKGPGEMSSDAHEILAFSPPKIVAYASGESSLGGTGTTTTTFTPHV
jgi:hypothetical protein